MGIVFAMVVARMIVMAMVAVIALGMLFMVVVMMVAFRMLLVIVIVIAAIGVVFVAMIVIVVVVVVMPFRAGFLGLVMIVVMIMIMIALGVFITVVPVIAVIAMIVRLKQRALTKIEQRGPLGLKQRRDNSPLCQGVDGIFHPRGQILTDPEHQIGVLQGLGFRRAQAVAVRRSPRLYNQVGGPHAVHHARDE